MLLRPGLVVENVTFGSLFVLLYRRVLQHGIHGPNLENWAMLNLETGGVVGEMPYYLRDDKVYRVVFEDD